MNWFKYVMVLVSITVELGLRIVEVPALGF